MWKGKNKAITFSFDDGVEQDKRLIALLDKYSLKATFNLASGYLGVTSKRQTRNGEVDHPFVKPTEVAEVYKNHEIAGHTLSHFNLTTMDEETIKMQVREDKRILEAVSGRKIQGMAYPCGGTNSNAYTAEVLRRSGLVRYARTNKMSFKFDMPKDLLLLDMSVHFAEVKKMYELADEFFNADLAQPACFSIWGHAYELDSDYVTWEEFEKFCQYISNKPDVFYGTNSEVYLGEE